MRDLIRDCRMPAVVVARPDLGTINHTLLSVAALQTEGITVLGIVVSHSRKVTRDEKKTIPVLRALSRLPVAEITPGGNLSKKDCIWMVGKNR